MLQKNTFGKKKFKFDAPVQKCHFGNFGNFSKMALLNACMKFEIFGPKPFFWSNMKMEIRKNIHNMSQGLPNQGFMQEKVQKGDFLKKPSRELKNYFVLGSCESLKRLEG